MATSGHARPAPGAAATGRGDHADDVADDDVDDDAPDGGTDDWSAMAGDFAKRLDLARRAAPSATGRTSDRETLRVHVEKFDGLVGLANRVTNRLEATRRREDAARVRISDKSDRATSEQVLDPRTRMILFKLLNRGVISSVNGCISTGKEANVYHAVRDGSSDEFAIKVYKTSILIFRDRDKYVAGEFRFRRGYCKSNPRKMVKTWAEKEMRNLARLFQAGIPCPEPLLLRAHVLLMRFIGADGWPAPQLRNAELSAAQLSRFYRDSIKYMRALYHDCRLVHADLSEYNMLVYRDTLYVIDVSQAVEHDHPHALEFLRKDCANVTGASGGGRAALALARAGSALPPRGRAVDFFARRGVATARVRDLFDFVTDPGWAGDRLEANLDCLLRAAAEQRVAAATPGDAVGDAVFQQVFIPRTLDDVADYERDIDALREPAAAEPVFYHTVTGLRPCPAAQEAADGHDAAAGADTRLPDPQCGAVDDAIDDDAAMDGSESGSDADAADTAPPADGWSKRERKQLTKQANRERRQHKIPKHVKKRKQKLAQRKRGQDRH